MKIITENRKARFDYEILDTFEAGIMLKGTEIKSIRNHQVSLDNTYVEVDKNNECWLIGANIELYKQGNVHNHAPNRQRKLLLKHAEIVKLSSQSQQKGFTIIPLKMYFNKKNIAKLEIAICRGKQKHDKRHAIKERDVTRDQQRGE